MTRQISILTLLLFSLACSRPQADSIVPVDYGKYFEQMADSNEAEQQELTLTMQRELESCTCGKRIPDVRVEDLNGKTIRLKRLLSNETIVIFSAHNSKYGREDAVTAFPDAIRNLGDEAEGVSIICLVENSKGHDRQAVSDYAWQLQKEYSRIYYIDVDEAQKINLIACPTKLFVNKEQVVAYMQQGFSFDAGDRVRIISEGIKAMQKKKL